METILINNNQFYYSVEVKKRKSMQIKLIKPYTIIITTPNILNNDMVKNILLQKSSWLIKHNLNIISCQSKTSALVNKVLFLDPKSKSIIRIPIPNNININISNRNKYNSIIKDMNNLKNKIEELKKKKLKKKQEKKNKKIITVFDRT